MHTLPPASEAMYFDKEPVAHIVAHQERQRLRRITDTGRLAVRRTLSLRFDR